MGVWSYTGTKQRSNTYHLDKTKDKVKLTIFEKEKELYREKHEAFKTLGLKTDDEHFKEDVQHDLATEEVISQFTTLFEVRFGNNKLFSKWVNEITMVLDRAKLFKQGATTNIISK